MLTVSVCSSRSPISTESSNDRGLWYLFAATVEDGEVEVGEVVSSLELGDGTTIKLLQFARVLQDARPLY